MKEALLGTRALIRLALRRDRIMLPVWIVLLAATAAATAAATIAVYPTAADRISAAASINATSSLVALYGSIYDPSSLGELSLFKMSVLGAALVAIMAMLTVVRHTRAEEETGRAEQIGAASVGRYAPLAAAVACSAGASLLTGAATAAALVAIGLPVAGSLSFGAAWAGVGITFAAIAALAAQLTRTARAANGVSGIVLAAAYLLRAVGDTAGPGGPSWLSWLAPIGWGEQVRAYAGDRWWVFALVLGFALVLTAIAAWLVGRRDLGSGLMPDRGGPPSASRWLSGPIGLAWRLQRGLLIAWTAACLLGGVLVGGIASHVGSLMTSPQAARFIAELGGVRGLTNAFIAAELSFLGVIVSVYAIQATARMHTEETTLRLEPVLATSIGRLRWATSHLVIVLAGSTIMLAVAGAAAGLARVAATGDRGDFGPVLAGALVQVPAVWVLAAIAVAVFGFVPRLAALAWAALVAFLLLTELGPVLRLDHWVLDLSPFSQLPKLPGSSVVAAPLAWLVVVAIGCAAAGLTAFRRRDIG